MREAGGTVYSATHARLAIVALVLSRALAGQPLASSMVVAHDLAWSHDGNTIYFSAMRVKRDYSDYTPAKWNVYSYDVQAGAVRLFARFSFSVATLSGRPAVLLGKLVAGNRDLYLLDARGRDLTRVTSDPAEDFAATTSPDGRWIAFTSKRNGHSEVYIARSDGSAVRRLTSHTGDRTLNPSWSPDGRHIAYFREKGDGKDQIHVTLVDGSSDVNVTDDAFNNVNPGWTPNGEVVYGQEAKDGSVRTFTVRVDGNDKRPFLDIHSSYARFSPDASKIAYIEDDAQTAGTQIVIAAKDGKILRRVPLAAMRAINE